MQLRQPVPVWMQSREARCLEWPQSDLYGHQQAHGPMVVRHMGPQPPDHPPGAFRDHHHQTFVAINKHMGT
jgi:hypothetical protein